jgi:anti-sigma factor ChrR (cupin superfamily)
MSQQTFVNTNTNQWANLDAFPGTAIFPLAEPVPQGSIHRLRMIAGTTIPGHVHPCDEYVYVLEGTIKTGDMECQSGTFWFTPAHAPNGPHYALTDVELLTIRLGAMGQFASQPGD